MGDPLSLGPELDVLDGDVVDDEIEVADYAHDGGVEAVGEDLGGEWVRRLDAEDGAGRFAGEREEQDWWRRFASLSNICGDGGERALDREPKDCSQ